MGKNGKKADWLLIIPLIFCGACILMSIAKMFQVQGQKDILNWLDCVNSNAFSTFLSMVICLTYRFFAGDAERQQGRLILSRRWIALTIIASVLYGVIAVIYAARYCLITSVLMAIASIAYIILFFVFMIKRN